MFLQLKHSFPADGVERAVPDSVTAERLLRDCRPDFLQLLERRRDAFREAFADADPALLDRVERALMISLARLGMRHGSWGDDFHHYHNENHALEILDGRLGRMMDTVGLKRLPLFEWLALSLFATCHDLRQREQVDFSHPIGNNEAASICETRRILALSGFDGLRDRGLYDALDMMIAGSTFDPRPTPPPGEFNTAEVVTTAGALAPQLPLFLDREFPWWREDPSAVRAVELAQMASDLDTANVGEAFPWLAESASRLCQEREMRSGRSLDAEQSAQPCLGFLSDGQERYFFELHRFCSDIGRDTFAAAKEGNAERLRQVASALREQFNGRGPRNGQAVVEAFSAYSLAP
ncbi:hypothetical protein [Pseudomarimonas salicorniae]|uniref:Uncharacterized protein n=1 Tax=Pseudomarimonas salicorniae TaxID=2933270 RepID=A0ABT0GDA7_9GAMM|nr:hypothetical protein [Lysobacter sp. CAU 1642]MCK7592534.1 hypothetical protein [Lysobacter sp. CAU 1642]